MRFDLNEEEWQSDPFPAELLNSQLDFFAGRLVGAEPMTLPEPYGYDFAVGVLAQLFAIRLIELGEAIVREWNGGHWLPMVTLSRSVIETAALAHKIFTQILDATKKMDGQKVHEIVMQTLFASRDEEVIATGLGQAATNILSSIDRFERSLTGIRRVYDRASEIVHPNSAGLMLLYSNRDYEKKIIQFSRQAMAGSEVIGFLTYAGGSMSAVKDVLIEVDGIRDELSQLYRD